MYALFAFHLLLCTTEWISLSLFLSSSLSMSECHSLKGWSHVKWRDKKEDGWKFGGRRGEKDFSLFSLLSFLSVLHSPDLSGEMEGRKITVYYDLPSTLYLLVEKTSLHNEPGSWTEKRRWKWKCTLVLWYLHSMEEKRKWCNWLQVNTVRWSHLDVQEVRLIWVNFI